jgi:hypothetical protein
MAYMTLKLTEAQSDALIRLIEGDKRDDVSSRESALLNQIHAMLTEDE